MPSAEAIARRAAELTHNPDPDAAVSELVALAGHQRRPLQDAQCTFVARLHRRSDDFEATHALRLLQRALDAVGWDSTPAAPPTPQRAALAERVRARLRLGRRVPAEPAAAPQPAPD